MLNNQVWFSGRDVAFALGYEKPRNAIERHVDEEDKQKFYCTETGRLNFRISNNGMVIINESGLYSLVLGSQLPSAKKFKRWVTSEVKNRAVISFSIVP